MNEVGNNARLRVYGSLLALTHLLTAYFWLDTQWGHIAHFTDAYPVCWPHLSGCESWGRMSVNGLFGVMAVYSGIAAAAGALFFAHPRWAFWLLMMASIFKFALFQLDYRLSGNYHYMHFWLLAAFFVLPRKTLSLRCLLIMFYLGASLLKMNREWLSGSAIWDNPYLYGTALRLGCWYVLLLESVIVFGLASRRPWIFWGTLAQLYLFHSVSYLIVGYYYPLLFMIFLTIFVIARDEDLDVRAVPRWSWAFISLFAVAQLVPFALGGDRAVEGRGRLFALSMFDALTECQFRAVVDGDRELPRLYDLEYRLRCDPHVLLAEARWRCRDLGQRRLDISLVSKKKTDDHFRPIFAFENFCQRPRRVNVWGFID